MTDATIAANQEVLVETKIKASPATVWKALTDDIGLWWPAEFYIGGTEGARSYSLEARPGGRVYEEWDEGGGLLWGQVCTAVPEKMLQATGFTFPQWGGPSIGFLTWTLEADGEGCSLRFTEQTLGMSSEGNRAEKTKGWTFLFGGVLKAHVEGTPPPKWED